MKIFYQKISLVAGLALALAPAWLNPSAAGQDLPPPANVKINFDRDIRPILETSCLRCHGPQKPRSHFRLDYREAALAGGDNNTNDILPGNSSHSLLIAYVARQVPDMEMPPPGRGEPLTPQQISLLRTWIDQGASWTTTNQPSPVNLAVEPFVQETGVQGNEAKFRELEETEPGASGGVQNFSFTEQADPNEKISVQGRANVPNDDFNFQLALDETDQGFIHAGFDQWRKYYAPDGGYNSTVHPSEFNPENNLHVDNGRVWVDLGLELPPGPQITLGYEYQYQKGNEATLDWGYANGKNIYPATQSLNEGTHIFTFDISENFDNWLLENKARLESYNQNNLGREEGILFGGSTPDQFITTRDNYRQTQGMDTLTLEKQLRDWWLLDGGFYYSRLAGSDFFNQNNSIPSLKLNSVLSSQKITLNRESEIFSVANLFSAPGGLAFSLATQNEWTREDGFGESIPDLELGGGIPANSSLDEFKASQAANFRFTKIPFTIISGDAQFSEDDYGIYQSEDTSELQRHTAADNFQYNLKTGFSTSPWQWSDLTVQYGRRADYTDYQQLEDLFLGMSGPTNGYPAFILERAITSDQFETKLELRPAPWLKMTLTWQITATDYSSKTDPAFDPVMAEIVSEGGFIADGRYHLQTYGISSTITPFRRLYLSGGFTYSRSSVITADNGDPSISPYRGNIFTVNAMGTFAVNLKTSLQLMYYFSAADYSQDNAAAGIPAGLDYQRHDLIAGLTRKLTKNLSGTLRYEFSQYHDMGNHANNYTANGFMAVLSYRWP